MQVRQSGVRALHPNVATFCVCKKLVLNVQKIGLSEIKITESIPGGK